MLCDEKDALLEKYGLIHVSREQLAELDGAAVKGSKSSPYGVEAVVERSRVPAGMQISPWGWKNCSSTWPGGTADARAVF